MEVKCLEVRDAGTFVPIICIRPVPKNDAQRWLLQRDGYRGDSGETCIIVAYDPYDWTGPARTMRVAHEYIRQHWHALKDGDVVDVEFILGERATKKTSES